MNNVLQYVNFDRALGGAFVFLLFIFLWGVVKAFKAVFRVKPKPSPALLKESDEIAFLSSKRLDLQSMCDKINANIDAAQKDLIAKQKAAEIAAAQLKDIKLTLAAAMKDVEREVEAKRVELEKGLETAKQSFADAQKSLKENTLECRSCKTRFVGLTCPKCFVKVKAGKVPYTPTEWDTVNRYLHDIGEWGEPANYQDNDYIYLPWPTENVSFQVGGVDYEWSKIDNEDDGTGWWAELRYEHPILGDMVIINQINENDDHFVTCSTYDDERTDLSAGSVEDLRADLRKGIKYGLTGLYLWMQNEKAEPPVKAPVIEPPQTNMSGGWKS